MRIMYEKSLIVNSACEDSLVTKKVISTKCSESPPAGFTKKIKNTTQTNFILLSLFDDNMLQLSVVDNENYFFFESVTIITRIFRHFRDVNILFL